MQQIYLNFYILSCLIIGMVDMIIRLWLPGSILSIDEISRRVSISFVLYDHHCGTLHRYTEYGTVPCDSRTFLLVLLLCHAYSVKLRLKLNIEVIFPCHINSCHELTEDATIEPPNHTAYLWRWWLITFTSIAGGGALWANAPNLAILACMRLSTNRFTSRCKRFPKSLNIVVPPESTMFLYRPRLTSIGHLTIASSTMSGNGVIKSELKISGLKNISGPRKRS